MTQINSEISAVMTKVSCEIMWKVFIKIFWSIF